MRQEMSKTICAIALILAALTMAVSAADVSVGVDFASAYVFRGVTFNDGMVLQPYIEASGAMTLGVWANHDIGDYNDAVEGGQFSEIDLYASYDLPIEVVGVSLGYTEYTYPHGSADADREVSLSLSKEFTVAEGVPLTPSIGVYYGLDGGIGKDLYIEAGLEASKDLAENLSLDVSAVAGYLSPDDDGAESGFSHLTAGLSLSYALDEKTSIGASAYYVGQLDDKVLVDVDEGGAYDTEFYGVISIAYAF